MSTPKLNRGGKYNTLSNEIASSRNYSTIGYSKKFDFKSHIPGARSNEVVLLNGRRDHIRKRHGEGDLRLFDKYKEKVISDPDEVLESKKNTDVVLFIKRIPKTNLKMVIKVAVDKDPPDYKNTILTFHSMNDKNLKALENTSNILYTRKK